LSADFLASEFIQADELPPLLMAAEQQGAVILPVIVSPCRFLKTPVLSRFQAVNDPSVPLIAMSRAESEAMLVKVTDAIEGAISYFAGFPYAVISSNTTSSLVGLREPPSFAMHRNGKSFAPLLPSR